MDQMDNYMGIKTEEGRYQLGQEAKNTKILVESLIAENKYNEALVIARKLRGGERKKMVDIFKENKPVAPKCPKCGDDLQQVFYENTIEWAATGYCLKCEYNRIKKEIAADAERIMHERGVGQLFLKARLTDFGADIGNAVKEGSYISGPRGVGKTHLVAAIMHQEIIDTDPTEIIDYQNLPEYTEPDRDDYPLMISVPELLLQVRSTFGQNKDNSEMGILKKYSNHPILILDDLGAEKGSTWAVSTLYLLINRRYEDQLKTYITSNLNLDDIAKRLDDRIASRIAGMCEVINLNGSDRRLNEHK